MRGFRLGWSIFFFCRSISGGSLVAGNHTSRHYTSQLKVYYHRMNSIQPRGPCFLFSRFVTIIYFIYFLAFEQVCTFLVKILRTNIVWQPLSLLNYSGKINILKVALTTCFDIFFCFVRLTLRWISLVSGRLKTKMLSWGERTLLKLLGNW